MLIEREPHKLVFTGRTEIALSHARLISSQRPLKKAHANEQQGRVFVLHAGGCLPSPSVVRETKGGQMNLAAAQSCSWIESYLGTDRGPAGNSSDTHSVQLTSFRPPTMSVIVSSSLVLSSSCFSLQVSL